MSKVSHIHVRSLEIGDLAFVQDLASKQPSFTIPPPYVLWLILRIREAICLIAEDSKDGPIAYLIAVPVEAPEKSVFVWQLAATDAAQKETAMLDLLTEFRKLVFLSDCKSVLFSTIPGSAVYRLIRQYAWDLGSVIPRVLHSLPPVVSSSESEFRLELPDPLHAASMQVLKKQPRKR